MQHTASSSIRKAVLNNDIKTVSELIRKGERIDIQDDLGYTPLHIAGILLRLECTEILLQHQDCDVNVRTFFGGSTSLFFACANKSPPLKLITSLLEHGADPNIPDNEKMSPIHFACKNGSLEVLKLLLKFNADINVQNINNYTPLHFAVDHNEKDTVEFLLTHNADTSVKNCFGFNPLMLSIDNRNNEMFSLILPYTTNLNSVGTFRDTAISLSIRFGNYEMTKTLIENGADVNNIEGESPLEILNFYREEQYETFQYVCSKINFSCLSVNTGLANILENKLTATNNIKNLKLILQSKDLHLNTLLCKHLHIFEKIFRVKDEYPNVEYFNNNKSNLIIVIDGLFKQGALISTTGYNTLLKFIKFCPYRVELFQVVLKNCDCLMNVTILLSAFSSHPDLGLLMLQYSPYSVTSKIFENLSINEGLPFLKYILLFFTPSFDHLHKFFILEDEISEIALLKIAGKVKSLKELSRDVTRMTICQLLTYNNCTENKQLYNVVKNLNCPSVVKDILMLKKAVNKVDVTTTLV